ncbi:interleukin-12 receptor subunit beta-1 isoform X2 [Xiphophorus couchianus]|uniref:interleukin-12 receptor subunit beta-1 isoform X2 n=1 Tax=Xiphophorus couchianus TaxID=32473 RepID=UPI001016F086|nr:interleukin-12 receptor subunit beta-1 isoform X2 [Xiphophorus couchianus]
MTFLGNTNQLCEHRLASWALLHSVMIIFLLYLMETFQHLSSLNGYVIFLLLATISKGSACEPPSSPLCFRQDEDKDVYICEWDFNTTETEVTFDFYFNDSSEIASKYKIGDIKENHIELGEERLIVTLRVDMWVEARAGKSICTSPIRSGILQNTVKYEPPQNINVFWLRNNLSLSWESKYPSLAEVWFRKYQNHEKESWEKRLMNTTNEAPKQKLLVVNLLKNTAYQVQIRQRSIQAATALWSNWSPVVIVPAEFEKPPLVRSTTTLLNGTQQVNLTWERMPQAAVIRGVTYIVDVTQPCKKKSHNAKQNSYTVYVSYSAANITVIARNAAGLSPPAVVHVPAASAPDLKTCDKTMLDKKLKNKTCLEFYELQDADLIPERVWCLTSKNRTNKRKEINNYSGSTCSVSITDMKNYTRYLYFEHKIHDGKPQTGKMCLYYKKEGVPSKEPQNFLTVSDTHDSADLTWKQISYEHLHGFLTHYKLCTVKINSQSKPPECINISASATKHHLKDLTPATKYNVTLAGVTQTGEGPVAMQSFTTLREKPFNVWISFGLLLGFFLFSIFCTVVLKRIKIKLFPPVPKPVMPDFSLRPPESEDMWERKEEVHEVTLHKLVPEQKPVSEATVLKGEWDDEAGQQVEKDGCCSGESDDESSSLASGDDTLRKADLKNLEQVEIELAMLIYRNGLVFDVKSELL